MLIEPFTIGVHVSCVREGFEALSGSYKLAGETVIKIAIGADAE